MEEIRAHVAPTVSPSTIGNHLLAAGLTSRVPLARLPLTPRHRQARYTGTVKESLVMRVGSVCIRVVDAHVYGVHLASVISRNAFTHDTTSWASTNSSEIHIWNLYVGTKGGLVAQAVRRSPPTAGVPSSRLGPFMWVLWCTKRGLGRLFTGFLPFSTTTNFIPPFLHTHLIHFVSFHPPL